MYSVFIQAMQVRFPVCLVFSLYESEIVLAGFLFLALNNSVDRLIENYYYSTDYEKAKDEVYLSKLQNYINENGLSSRDTAELSKWVKKQKILVLQVYMDNKKIFDSDYPDKQFWEEDIESNEYEWETYYSIEFSDGSARVGIIGMYEYQLYNYALIAELLLSFVVFLVLVLLGIRKKMKYISELSEEIAFWKEEVWIIQSR